MNLVWLREDLRVEDQLALYYAAQEKKGLIALYLITPDWWERHYWGSNKQVLIKQTLFNLSEQLKILNIPLIIKKVDGNKISDQVNFLKKFIKEFKISKIYFNRQYEVRESKRDLILAQDLKKEGIITFAFDDQLLFPAGAIRSSLNKPLTVFTPFKKKAYSLLNQMIVSVGLPAAQPMLGIKSDIEILNEWNPIADSIIPDFMNNNQDIESRLEFFVKHHLNFYDQERDIPSLDGTSKVSIPLSIGAISIRGLWKYANLSKVSAGQQMFLSELLWREFYKNILIDFPHVGKDQAFKKNYNNLLWIQNKSELEAWKNGQTGFPLVDAGMRQLKKEGWMHNRVRMVVAMFLTKLMLHSWQEGERHFAYWLFDYDFSANNGGWQWSSSTGTDAAPYFRIFNPWTQIERFDPQAEYIKKYVPELNKVPEKAFYSEEKFRPYRPPHYPAPIIDYEKSRARAIEFFKKNGESDEL